MSRWGGAAGTGWQALALVHVPVSLSPGTAGAGPHRTLQGSWGVAQGHGTLAPKAQARPPQASPRFSVPGLQPGSAALPGLPPAVPVLGPCGRLGGGLGWGPALGFGPLLPGLACEGGARPVPGGATSRAPPSVAGTLWCRCPGTGLALGEGLLRAGAGPRRKVTPAFERGSPPCTHRLPYALCAALTLRGRHPPHAWPCPWHRERCGPEGKGRGDRAGLWPSRKAPAQRRH